MPRYLLTHKVKAIPESQEGWIQDWKGLRKRSGAAAQWLRSLYAAETGRLYCEWEAENPEAIRACFVKEELEMAPIERLDEVAFLDPAWLDDGPAPGRP